MGGEINLEGTDDEDDQESDFDFYSGEEEEEEEEREEGKVEGGAQETEGGQQQEEGPTQEESGREVALYAAGLAVVPVDEKWNERVASRHTRTAPITAQEVQVGFQRARDKFHVSGILKGEIYRECVREEKRGLFTFRDECV